MSNIENLKALLALKAEADPIQNQLVELGKKWKAATDSLESVLAKDKTYVFTADDGSLKLAFYQNGQLMLGDAVAAETVPEPAPEPAEPENVTPLTPVQ